MIVLPGHAGQNNSFTEQRKEVEFRQKMTLEDDKYSGEQLMTLSMRSLAGLTGVLVLALFSHVDAATLNKCIDAKGEVTYSNLPCANAQKTRTVEIDPAPPPEPAQAQPAVSEPPAPVREPAPTHVKTPRASAPSLTRASPSKCEALTDKLGKVIDKMDQAHRKGYTQKQMDAWNLEVKELERKKQQSGCF